MDTPTKHTITTFQDLDAWKLSHTLVLEIYTITKAFPKEELFGISLQMRRSAVSITSNIAEGFGRHSFKDKIHFYTIARGSLMELQNQLIICRDIGIVSKSIFEKLNTLSTDTQRVINGLIRSSGNHL